MKIEHVMSNLIVVDIDTSLDEVAKIMKEYDIGFVPVNKDNKIIGVLTDRDIVTKIIANKDSKIEGYINTELITIDLNKSLEDAINLMGEKKVKRLLVSDKDKLVGIVSMSDIINNIDGNILVNNLKKIWEIYRNTDEYKVKINDFYL